MRTKGKLVMGAFCRILDINGSSVALGAGDGSSFGIKTNEANAEHLVKCWNAFEPDGLVEKLVGALESWDMVVKTNSLGTNDVATGFLAAEAEKKTTKALGNAKKVRGEE